MTYQLLRFHTLSVAYALTLAKNWITLLSGKPQTTTTRTPIIRLTNEMRKLNPPSANDERQKPWLVG
jgi:hypothetical protein